MCQKVVFVEVLLKYDVGAILQSPHVVVTLE